MIVVALLAASAAQSAPSSLVGDWVNQKGSVVVSIAHCAADALCGTVVSASDKAKADAARGGTADLVGTEIMHDFVAAGPRRWKGVLFVPDIAKRSKAEIVELDDGRLKVRGCAVGKILCKSQIWARVVPN